MLGWLRRFFEPRPHLAHRQRPRGWYGAEVMCLQSGDVVHFQFLWPDGRRTAHVWRMPLKRFVELYEPVPEATPQDISGPVTDGRYR